VVETVSERIALKSKQFARLMRHRAAAALAVVGCRPGAQIDLDCNEVMQTA